MQSASVLGCAFSYKEIYITRFVKKWVLIEKWSNCSLKRAIRSRRVDFKMRLWFCVIDIVNHCIGIGSLFLDYRSIIDNFIDCYMRGDEQSVLSFISSNVKMMIGRRIVPASRAREAITSSVGNLAQKAERFRVRIDLIEMAVDVHTCFCKGSAVRAAVLSVDSFCICSTSLSGWLPAFLMFIGDLGCDFLSCFSTFFRPCLPSLLIGEMGAFFLRGFCRFFCAYKKGKRCRWENFFDFCSEKRRSNLL